MIKNKKINIRKNIFKNKIFKKNEMKKKILKSIIQNKNVKPLIRSYAFYKLSRLKFIYSISKQNNICLYTGKIKSIFKKYNMSRQLIKKNSYINNLQNSLIINW